MNRERPLRILNYGAGAVGLGLDSFLLSAGAEVVIVGRSETIAALKDHGLSRFGIFGNVKIPPQSFQCYDTLAPIHPKAFDYILVSVKSFDSPKAAQDLFRHPRLWNKRTKFILCQNGWGNAELFINLFAREQVCNARIITGFQRRKPSEVDITVHADAIHLGSLFHSSLAGLEPLAQALTAGGIPCQTVPDISKDLWAKMLYNCALNPLGAIFHVCYGDLGKNEFSRALMHDIITEIFGVMQAGGYTTHWPMAADYLNVFYEKFLPATAEHFSSTLQDLAAGKRTEINALNGMIVRLAEPRQLKAEANRTVFRMVKFLEEKNCGQKTT